MSIVIGVLVAAMWAAVGLSVITARQAAVDAASLGGRLHYTGVAGFICTPTTADLPLSGLSPSGLAPWVAGISLVYLWSVLIFGVYDRRLYARSLAEAHRLDLFIVSSNTQEEERLRLARELHDQLGQDLIGQLLLLKSLEPSVQTDSARDTRRQLQSLTAEMDRKVHDLAWELRPASLEAGGLRSALESYLLGWSAGLKVAFGFYHHCFAARI